MVYTQTKGTAMGKNNSLRFCFTIEYSESFSSAANRPQRIELEYSRAQFLQYAVQLNRYCSGNYDRNRSTCR